MNRTFAVLNPVQFVPGEPNVMIPVQQVGTARQLPLESINTTREKLITSPQAEAALNAIEAAIIAEAQAELTALYEGDTVEVLTAAQWAERNAPPATEEPPA